MEPVALHPLGHQGHVDALNALGLDPGKGMAFDAGERGATDKMPACRLHLGIGNFKCHFWDRGDLSLVGRGEHLGEMTHIGLTKAGHGGQHVGTIVGPLVENLLEIVLVELDPDQIERWRNPTFITHFRLRSDEKLVVFFRGTTLLVA